MKSLAEILTCLFSRYDLKSQGADAFTMSANPANPYYSLSPLGMAWYFSTRTGLIDQANNRSVPDPIPNEDSHNV
ncbi:MAG: hypothetical protein BroJett011_77890 [Chloroflexota bacterium]|nr:MAG: hypothetical protein BroJett011_77890 [Chloroflexota bacterium]